MTLLHIERFSAAGEGFARDEAGNSWLVPGGLIGDDVEVLAQGGKKGLHVAERLKIVTPSSERVASYCPVQRCGGCAWRELDLPAAAAVHKRERIREALRHIGRLDIEVAPTLTVSGVHYRHRARLHLSKKRVGFHERGSNTIVPFSSCAVLLPGLAQRLLPLVAALQKQGEQEGELEVMFSPDDDRLVVELSSQSKQADKWYGFWAEQVSKRAIAGVILITPSAKQKLRRCGEPHVLLRHPQYAADAPRFFLEPGAFSQANLAANALLVRWVREAVLPNKRVLEWHAGAGNLTLAYADQAASVTASEWDEQAIMCARRNIEVHGVVHKVRIVQAKDSDVPLGDAQILLLDPPRTGAKQACERVAHAPQQLERIVYVSCDPGSLARDLQSLALAFDVTSVTPLDMFAGTPHVETLVILDRKTTPS